MTGVQTCALPISGRWVVDLPGYGFAKVPDHERDRWKEMIEGYLTTRPTLSAVLVLVDSEIGPTPLDLQMFEWLAHIGLVALPVATKADKVNVSSRLSRRENLATRLGVTVKDIAWVSAVKGIGIPELRTAVTKLLTAP